MDGDKEVSWEEAKRQYGIGEEGGDKSGAKEQVKGAKVVTNTSGIGIRKTGNNYEIFNTADVSDDGSDANTISEISMGITPAGIALDLYTLSTEEDFFTEKQVPFGWRLAGVFPYAS